MKNFAVYIALFLFMMQLNPVSAQVDLSIDEVWPAIYENTGAVTDQDYPYFGGYKNIPKHTFWGFFNPSVSVTNPGGSGDVGLTLFLEVIKDPNGNAIVTDYGNQGYTVSTGEGNILQFEGSLGTNGKGEYELQTYISSNDDPNDANDSAAFAFNITDSVYSFADLDDISQPFVFHNYPNVDDGDAFGQVYYFPPVTGEPYIINSLEIYLRDDYTGVVNNGNGILAAVVFPWDDDNNEWDLDNPLMQSNGVVLTPADFNNFVEIDFIGDNTISTEGKYLFTVYVFNNNDATDQGKIAFGANSDMQVADDLKSVAIVDDEVITLSGEYPVMVVNVEEDEVGSNDQAEITSFTIPEGLETTINAETQSVMVELEADTDFSNLIATFSLSSGASATVDGVSQVSGVTPNDFTNPLIYKITSQDGQIIKYWTVTAFLESTVDHLTDILSYEIPGQIESSINNQTHSVSVLLPSATNVTNLMSVYTLSRRATTTVGGVSQYSGVSTNDFTNPVDYMVLAHDEETSQNWTVTVTTESSASNETEILSFGFVDQVESIINTELNTVSVTMPPLTDVTALMADFSLSDGATAYVDGVLQVNASTINDFTNPVTYTVLAEDGETSEDWIVTVTVEEGLSSETEILTYSIPGQTESAIIDAGSNTIAVTMPAQTDVTALIAEFTLSDGATATVGGTAQESGVSSNNFTDPVTYTVLAEDGETSENWTVSVAFEEDDDPEAEILTFSIPGQVESTIDNITNNISVLMPMGTDVTGLIAEFTLSDGATATIDGTEQQSGVTSNDFTNPVIYTVTSSNEEIIQSWTVIVNTMLYTNTEIISFSIDGQAFNASITDGAINVFMPEGTDMTSLVATFELATGATATVNDVIQESGVTVNDFSSPVTYVVSSFDDSETQDWIVTVEEYIAGDGDFIEYSIIGQYQSVINPGNRTVTVDVFDNLDFTQLVAEFMLPEGATAMVGGTTQESGVTPNDFTNPVEYQVNTAKDIVFWEVTANPISASTPQILEFSLPNQVSSIINENEKIISVVMPSGADITSVAAEFTLSEGDTAYVNGVIQESGVTQNDFTTDVVYSIIAFDGTTTADYTVSVTVLNSGTDFLSYYIPMEIVPTMIDPENKTITISMAVGTNVTALVPTFELSAGAIAQVDGVSQESGVTANDFTNPVVYTVTAENGEDVQDWTATVQFGNLRFLTYSIEGQVSSSIDNDNRVVDVLMPPGTDVSSLIAEFTYTGDVVAVNEIVQESGITENDFTDTVFYTIYANEGTVTQVWAVIVEEQIGNALISSFAFDEQISCSIDEENFTIDVLMPFTADLTSLVAIFDVSAGAVVTIDGTVQESGVTPNDFTSAVTYTVTNNDGSVVNDYTVNVELELSGIAEILSYSIQGYSDTIDVPNQYVRVEMPGGTNLNSLVADFTLSQGAEAKVDGILQVSGSTANNFTDFVTYVVEGANGIQKEWVVDVVDEDDMNSGTNFIAFGFYGQTNPATINTQNHTITVNLDPGLDINTLMPTFYLSEGARAYIGNELHWSGKNVLDFTNPVTYTVVAQDNTTQQDWTVTVTNNQNASADFLTYRFTNFADSLQTTSIYPGSNSIYVDILLGSQRDSLVAEFTVSPGAVVKVGASVQNSGITYNDFNSPVVYTVTAQDGTTSKEWVVTVDFFIGLENAGYNHFSVYPNPVSDYMTLDIPVDFNSATMMIVDMSGRVNRMQNIQPGKQIVSVNGLNQGVYYVVIQTDNERYLEKIIVQ